MAGLGELLSFVAFAVARNGASLLTRLRVGVIYFDLFEHVGIRFAAQRLGTGATSGSALGGGELSLSLSAAMLTATALGVWLLYRGGRAVADAAGGPALARVLRGATVAPAFAVCSLLWSLLVRFSFHVPQNSILWGDFTLRSVPMEAIVWPLLIAAGGGLAGGMRSASEHGERSAAMRIGLGAWAGGLRMLAAGLGLSFLGLLLVSAVRPDSPAAALTPSSARYFRAVYRQGPARGTVVLAHHLLLIPNEAMWTLVPAMGGCDGFSVGPISQDLLCYRHFPTSIGVSGNVSSPTPIPQVQTGSAPAGYLLFLLVPAIATVAGGMRAARAGDARSRSEAVVVGAVAGAVFALLVVGGGLVAGAEIGARLDVGGFSASGAGEVGPRVLGGAVLGLLWGGAGGALGGLLVGRGLETPTAPASPIPDAGFGVGAPAGVTPRSEEPPDWGD